MPTKCGWSIEGWRCITVPTCGNGCLWRNEIPQLSCGADPHETPHNTWSPARLRHCIALRRLQPYLKEERLGRVALLGRVGIAVVPRLHPAFQAMEPPQTPGESLGPAC